LAQPFFVSGNAIKVLKSAENNLKLFLENSGESRKNQHRVKTNVKNNHESNLRSFGYGLAAKPRISLLPQDCVRPRAPRARLGVTLGEGASRCLQPGCVEFAPLLFRFQSSA
jgi:hypothetical protein